MIGGILHALSFDDNDNYNGNENNEDKYATFNSLYDSSSSEDAEGASMRNLLWIVVVPKPKLGQNQRI